MLCEGDRHLCHLCRLCHHDTEGGGGRGGGGTIGKCAAARAVTWVSSYTRRIVGTLRLTSPHVLLQATLKPNQVSTDNENRLCHTFGKNYRDLWRVRNGLIERPPDAVVFPSCHQVTCMLCQAFASFSRTTHSFFRLGVSRERPSDVAN